MPSVLRPHVLASKRLFSWVSPHAIRVRRNRKIMYSATALSAHEKTLRAAIGHGSWTNYGGGLARFQEFCDNEDIPEFARMPASEELVSLFISSWAGRASRSIVDTWVSAVRAWHIVHGAEWQMGTHLRFIKNGVSKLVPESSKRPPRPPVSNRHMAALHNHLDMSNTFDSAVLACADSGYFGCNRLGELLPISSTSFDPTRFATRENVSFGTDNHGIHFYDIKAPWTKTTGFEGASLLVSEQAELDPISTMHHHLVINRAVPDSSPLFSFQTAKGWSVLTKDLFLTRCNEIWTDSSLPCMTGHSFRIGGATEMLARGIPPEIVAKQGRWRSDAFLIYWRRIELILPLWTSSS
ncbi:hypothetical protein DFH06DRAFT_1038988, partial [Mycena polygramma]